MAPRSTAKEVEDEDEEEFTGEVIHRNFLKIPTYDQNLGHIVSCVGYKGFLDDIASLNNGLLPFTARRLVQQAWTDLITEKGKLWKTTHSKNVQYLAVKKGLAQINPAIYQSYCSEDMRQDKPASFQGGGFVQVNGFSPIVWKFDRAQQLVKSHPRHMYRLLKLPQAPIVSAPPDMKHPRMRNVNGEGELEGAGGLKDDDDDDYETSTTIKAGPKRMKRGPYKKRAKVTRGDGEFSD